MLTTLLLHAYIPTNTKGNVCQACETLALVTAGQQPMQELLCATNIAEHGRVRHSLILYR